MEAVLESGSDGVRGKGGMNLVPFWNHDRIESKMDGWMDGWMEVKWNPKRTDGWWRGED